MILYNKHPFNQTETALEQTKRPSKLCTYLKNQKRLKSIKNPI